jgi:hypothetical protein
MSSVKLYQQVANAISPQLRPLWLKHQQHRLRQRFHQWR